MAIGERIGFFRTLRGMTQKFLGMKIGFPERSADVRIAQYETGKRSPKADVTEALANALDVSPKALMVPDIDTDLGLMHTLFALEDQYGLRAEKIGDQICLKVDVYKGTRAIELNRMLRAWQEQAAKLKNGEITKEEYDRWRYKYPKYDTARNWANVPSQELSDAIAKGLKSRRK